VSRTPVREALRRLADERLAIRLANRGTIVAPMSLDDVLAVYLVREQLEGLAAQRATEHMRHARDARIRSILGSAELSSP
jgi:DNA-binding GntR family transcriptional regulator